MYSRSLLAGDELVRCTCTARSNIDAGARACAAANHCCGRWVSLRTGTTRSPQRTLTHTSLLCVTVRGRLLLYIAVIAQSSRYIGSHACTALPPSFVHASLLYTYLLLVLVVTCSRHSSVLSVMRC